MQMNISDWIESLKIRGMVMTLTLGYYFKEKMEEVVKQKNIKL